MFVDFGQVGIFTLFKSIYMTLSPNGCVRYKIYLNNRPVTIRLFVLQLKKIPHTARLLYKKIRDRLSKSR